MDVDWVKMAAGCGIILELGEIKEKNGCLLGNDGGRMWN